MNPEFRPTNSFQMDHRTTVYLSKDQHLEITLLKNTANLGRQSDIIRLALKIGLQTLLNHLQASLQSNTREQSLPRISSNEEINPPNDQE